MTIVIFIIILLALVLAHESGHFFAAKFSNVRVDEFAFGFPPRLFKKKKGETTYSFNAIPIGGYVKISGENGDSNSNDKRSFSNKNPFTKIFILAMGVVMNMLLAFILITISVYMTNTFIVNKGDASYEKFIKEGRVGDETTIISHVIKNSPAEKSGLKPGYKIDKIFLNQEDVIGHVSSQKPLDLKKSDDEIIQNISIAINNNDTRFNDSVTIVYRDNEDKVSSKTIAGIYGLSGEKEKKMIGVSFAKAVEINLRFFEAIRLGFNKTVDFTMLTIKGFIGLFGNLFAKGDLPKDIAGPVGIFNMVGEAKTLGVNYLLLFAAVLSISLAVFNILPFPALDGGRILFVIIEWVSGKKISDKWQGILNSLGFIILILLMVIVTVKDVLNLF